MNKDESSRLQRAIQSVVNDNYLSIDGDRKHSILNGLDSSNFIHDAWRIEKEHKKYFTYLFLKDVARDQSQWEDDAPISIEELYDAIVVTSKPLDEDYLEILLISAFKMITEAEIRTGKLTKRKMSRLKYILQTRALDIFETHGEDFLFYDTSFAMEIYRDIMNPNVLERVREVENTYEQSNEVHVKVLQQTKEWDARISEREKKVSELEARLKEVETGFNFVGLFGAFQNLVVQKNKDLKEANEKVVFWQRIIFGVPMILLFMVAMFTFAETPLSALGYAPYVTLVLISLLFYRANLMDVKSIKSQLVQLELRQALCQFIQKYAEYSGELMAQNEHTLKKFEDIIFSNIVIEQGDIPATLDGMDQLGKLLSNLKTKG